MKRKLLDSVKQFRATSERAKTNRHCRSASFWIICLIATAAIPGYVAAQQESANQAGVASSGNALGQGTFRTQCAACHGLDGRGGEHAPSIVRDEVKSLSDEDLTRIVHNGILRKGMPEFSSLGPAAIKSVVSYLRELQGVVAPEAVTGDATQGRALFFGKAECSGCHAMYGTGNFTAADLSDYGRNHQPSEIRAAILKTAKPTDSPAEQATVTTRTGKELSGVVRDEDNFSLQLQDAGGDFYLIMKSDVVQIRRAPVPAMPSDYSKRLTPQEVDDLVSYIAKPSPR